MADGLDSAAVREESRPGRACPVHYHYPPEVFHREPDLLAQTLYVVGGLYGNPFALAAVLEMAGAEAGPVKLVFNGDFHWFDIDAPSFAAVDGEVLAHAALRGNVETELAAHSDSAGCGCGYPEWVGEAEVERSNAIMRALRRTAAALPERAVRLGALPMHLVAEVGGLKVGIVHGDAESLAGWSFSQERLRCDAERAGELLARARVRVLACSHTCLPVAQDFDTPGGTAVIVNNGAAGMPNFAGERFGLITRISTRSGKRALYRAALDGVSIEALPVRYDHKAWLAHFDRHWPAGSSAALSYRGRIADGPAYAVAQAARGRVRPVPRAGQGSGG